jgi:integrase
MKAPSGSGKGKNARIEWTICPSCEKSWADVRFSCPWCGRTDPTGRRKTSKRLSGLQSSAARQDVERQWASQLRATGTIGGRASAEIRSDRTFRALVDLCHERYFIPPVYKDQKVIDGIASYADARQRSTVLAEYLGEKVVSAITPADCDAVRIKLHSREATHVRGPKGKVQTGRTLSIATVNHYMKLLRRILAIAIDEGWIATSPFKKQFVQTKLERARSRVVTFEEEDALLAQCVAEKRRDRLRLAIVAAVETGMRQAEIVALQRWPRRDDDGHDMPYVDWKARVIHVPSVYSKTKRARMVPISTRLMRELRSRQSEMSSTEASFFAGVDSINTAWNGAKRAALATAPTIADVQFRDLKHTATTRMTTAGIPGDIVSMVVDHADQQIVEAAGTTRRVYLNMTPDVVDLVIRKLDAAWAKRTGAARMVTLFAGRKARSVAARRLTAAAAVLGRRVGRDTVN